MLALSFRVRMLRTGLWPSLFTSAYCLAYFALTWGHPHRAILAGLCVVTTVGSLAIAHSPIERLAGSRWCEPFFLGWSASVIAAVLVGVALDGGVQSPLTPLFFLPLVYAALSYPLRSMLAVGAMTLCAYIGLVLGFGGASLVTAGLETCALGTATWICAWQALNHSQQRRALSEISRSDPLTGCLNRRGFTERFTAELADSARHQRGLALVLIDLDRFKAVSDSHGHAAGDELLCWVATRLLEIARPHDSVGRLGGDEFGLLLPGAGSEALTVKRRIVATLGERTAVSAGVASFPVDAIDEMGLHHVADSKLYAHKLGDHGGSGATGQLDGELASIAEARPAPPS